MYGLSQEYVEYLRLPNSTRIKVYDLDKIVNSRMRMTIAEKITQLIDIKQALERKLEVLRRHPGARLKDFEYFTP